MAVTTSIRWCGRRSGSRRRNRTPPADVDYLDAKTAAIKAKELLLAKYDDNNYGYLRIHVDEN